MTASRFERNERRERSSLQGNPSGAAAPPESRPRAEPPGEARAERLPQPSFWAYGVWSEAELDP